MKLDLVENVLLEPTAILLETLFASNVKLERALLRVQPRNRTVLNVVSTLTPPGELLAFHVLLVQLPLQVPEALIPALLQPYHQLSKIHSALDATLLVAQPVN